MTAWRWLSLTPLLAASVLVVGCPPRETEIVISESGAATLLGACTTGNDALASALSDCRDLEMQCIQLQSSCPELDCGPAGDYCDGIELLNLTGEDCTGFRDNCLEQAKVCGSINEMICNGLQTLCEGAIETYGGVCGLPDLDSPEIRPASELDLGVQIVLTRGLGSEALVRSGCGVAAVKGSDLAAGLNDAVAQALGEDGLQHESVEDPEDAVPFMLLFYDRNGEGVGCEPDELFACAALGRRSPAEESYDILCGSCQKGLLPALPTAPCEQQCMLPYCQSLLGR